MPKNFKELYHKGLKLFDSGKHKEAADMLKEASDLKRNDYQPWKSLGDVYKSNRELDQAIVAYRKANELKPEMLNHSSLLALTLSENGEHDEDIEIYNKILKENSKSPIV